MYTSELDLLQAKLPLFNNRRETIIQMISVWDYKKLPATCPGPPLLFCGGLRKASQGSQCERGSKLLAGDHMVLTKPGSALIGSTKQFSLHGKERGHIPEPRDKPRLGTTMLK